MYAVMTLNVVSVFLLWFSSSGCSWVSFWFLYTLLFFFLNHFPSFPLNSLVSLSLFLPISSHSSCMVRKDDYATAHPAAGSSSASRVESNSRAPLSLNSFFFEFFFPRFVLSTSGACFHRSCLFLDTPAFLAIRYDRGLLPRADGLSAHSFFPCHIRFLFLFLRVLFFPSMGFHWRKMSLRLSGEILL